MRHIVTGALALAIGFAALAMPLSAVHAHVPPESLTVQVYEFGNRKDVWIIEGTKVQVRLDEMRHVNYHWEIESLTGSTAQVLSEEHTDKAVMYADMAGSYILTFNTAITDPQDQRGFATDLVLKYLDDKGKTVDHFYLHISVRGK